MARKSNKISEHWIHETRNTVRSFLEQTHFPDPERIGARCPTLTYPEWLIIFICWIAVRKIAAGYLLQWA